MELENKVPEQINDIKKENLEKLAQLFPSIIKDGQVDFKALKEELGEFEEVKEERYEFTWAGKQSAKKKVQEDVGARTLKYIEEDSKNSDTTENLYIEGDNLEILKLLRQNYYGSIKMIYIDPPYNTGNDFVYKDNFSQDGTESDIQEGSRDKEGNRLEINSKSSNRYHANWLNMMYSRLKVARDLLTDDGVIFISIGEQEEHNLRKICDEIFGEINFLGNCGRISKKANNQGDYWAPNFDYLLTYSKNKDLCEPFFGGINYDSYNLIEEKGERKGERYQLVRLYMTSLDPMRGCSNQRYFIECPDGSFVIPPGNVFPKNIREGENISPESSKDKVWRWSLKKYLENKEKIVIKKVKSSNLVNEKNQETCWNVFVKTYLKDVISKSTATPNNFIEEHINQKASHELKKMNIPFDFAKPSSLIKFLCVTCKVEKNDIVLDFFSGSATTAHAVMQLNAEDGGNRKYIMVQLPEEVDEKSEAYKFLKENNKPTNICEIGKERIRRAGELIKKEIEESNKQLQLGEEPKKVPDIGFKVFRTADTNINWKKIKEVSKDNVMKFDDPDMLDFTLGFNDKDVVYEVLLRQRDLPLSEKLVTLTDIGSRTYLYADSYLVCLETNVTEELIEKLAELNPLPIKFIFRDSAFGSKIGLKEETFRKLKTLVEKNSGLTKKAYTVEFI